MTIKPVGRSTSRTDIPVVWPRSVYNHLQHSNAGCKQGKMLANNNVSFDQDRGVWKNYIVQLVSVWVCVCVCVQMCVCMYAYVCVCVCVCMHVCVGVGVCVHACVYVHACLCVCVCVQTCLQAWMCAWAIVCREAVTHIKYHLADCTFSDFCFFLNNYTYITQNIFMKQKKKGAGRREGRIDSGDI